MRAQDAIEARAGVDLLASVVVSLERPDCPVHLVLVRSVRVCAGRGALRALWTSYLLRGGGAQTVVPHVCGGRGCSPQGLLHGLALGVDDGVPGTIPKGGRAARAGA